MSNENVYDSSAPKPRLACTKQLEVAVAFETCNHVPHFVETLQRYIDCGLENQVYFNRVEYCRGDYLDCNDPHPVILFFVDSQEDGDWAAGQFGQLDETMWANCYCSCPDCSEPPTEASGAGEELKALGL